MSITTVCVDHITNGSSHLFCGTFAFYETMATFVIDAIRRHHFGKRNGDQFLCVQSIAQIAIRGNKVRPGPQPFGNSELADTSLMLTLHSLGRTRRAVPIGLCGTKLELPNLRLDYLDAVSKAFSHWESQWKGNSR